MTKQGKVLHQDISKAYWQEELFRARQFKEATQKRKQEKLVQKQMEGIKKKTTVGRLRIEAW